jgi:hypothetical protein
MYKMLTGIIARRISTHLEEHNLLPAEQKDVTQEVKGARPNCSYQKQYLMSVIRGKRN